MSRAANPTGKLTAKMPWPFTARGTASAIERDVEEAAKRTGPEMTVLRGVAEVERGGAQVGDVTYDRALDALGWKD